MQWSTLPALHHIIALGAGHGDLLRQCLSLKAQHVVAVEADPALAAELKQHYQQKSVVIQEAAIATKTAAAVLYRYNLPQCNALSTANKALKQLFPGLKLQEQQELETIELAKLLQPCGLKGQQNLLLLELPAQNLALLEHLASHALLKHFNHLVLQHSTEPLYNGAASLADIKAFLAKEGYEIQDMDDSDPDFPVLRFYRDAQAMQLKQAEATIAKLQQQLAAEKKQSEQQKAELSKQLEQAKQQVKQEQQTLQSHLKESEEKLDVVSNQLKEKEAEHNATLIDNKALSKRISGLKKELESLSQKLQLADVQLQAKTEHQQGLLELQKSMKHLFEQNRLQLEQAANALGQHISQTGSKSTQQVQAFVQCQQALGKNLESLYYQDQTLPPELALLLNNKLINSSYDTTLVLGSGVVTHFMASQLQQAVVDAKRLEHGAGTAKSSYLTAEQGDLPQRLIAFEHKKNLSETLDNHLQQKGLSLWAAVHFAPLIETHYSGKDYLFYDIRKPLARLSELYEGRKGSRFMVILATESAADNLSVEACLPMLLQELGCHQVELLVYPADDITKGLVEEWSALLESRDIDYRLFIDERANALILHLNC